MYRDCPAERVLPRWRYMSSISKTANGVKAFLKLYFLSHSKYRNSMPMINSTLSCDVNDDSSAQCRLNHSQFPTSKTNTVYSQVWIQSESSPILKSYPRWTYWWSNRKLGSYVRAPQGKIVVKTKNWEPNPPKVAHFGQKGMLVLEISDYLTI